MTDDLEFRISKLALGPDDVLLVKVNGHVSDTVFQRVNDHVARALLGANVRTLVYDNSIDLAVLTRAEIDARTSDVEDAA